MTGQWKAVHDYKYVVEEVEVVGTSAGRLRHPFWWQTSQLAICCCIRHKLLPHNGHALAAIRVLIDNNLLYWWWWWLLWPVVLLTHACSRQLQHRGKAQLRAPLRVVPWMFCGWAQATAEG